MTTSIQSACDAPEQFKNRSRPVFLQPIRERVGLDPLRSLWDVTDHGGFLTIRDAGGLYLSVKPDGSLIDLYPVDDGSGRQRWAREPAPDGAVRLRVAGGMNAGAPTYLARMGNLKLCLRAGPAPQTAWRLLGPPPPKAPKPPSTPGNNAELAPRDVLLAKRGRALAVCRCSRQFAIFSDLDVQCQAIADELEKSWATYAGPLGFAAKDSVVQAQDWDEFKKAVYLGGQTPPGPCGGCPESGHGYEYQATTDAGKSYLVTGGWGPKSGLNAHELGHLMQVATGGFTWGGTCPWAWESSAQFMRWHGCPSEEDSESLKPWLANHSRSIERHDGTPTAYPYGSWFWWMFLDGEFGAGTTGRVWTTATAPEMPLAACARVTGVALADLFARFVGACLTQRYYKGGPRWDRVNATIGHAGGWATFDALRESGPGYEPAAQDLEPGGFHALRLSDGKARGPKRLRLDAANPNFRAVVVVDGAVRCVLRAGESTPQPVPVAKTVVGICVVGDPPGAPSQRYALAATA